MRRLLAVGLVLLLLGGAAPMSGVASMGGSTPGTKSLSATQDFDSVEFHITVYEGGAARWTFRYKRTLNESERQRFKEFAKRFNSNNDTSQLFVDFQRQATKLVSTGQNVTDDPMQATNFTKEARIGGDGLNDNRGVVEMSFLWRGFATADNQSLVIGHVFDGGLYLGPNQSLMIHTGEGLNFTEIEPDTGTLSGETLRGSDTVTWEGEYEFTDEKPRVRFEPTNRETTIIGERTTADTTDRPGSTTPGAGGPNRETGPPFMMAVGAAIVLLGLAAAFAWRQGSLGSVSTGRDNPDGGAGEAVISSGSGSDGEPAVSDEELLTDEARVKKLLDENGGRMKQVNIVEETGWSKSKVSMLLSEMEDKGDISKLRVGRENIISLDGHEPDAAGSPLDE